MSCKYIEVLSRKVQRRHCCNTIKDKKRCPRPGSQILGVARQGILRLLIPIPTP